MLQLKSSIWGTMEMPQESSYETLPPEEKSWSFILREYVTPSERDHEFFKLRRELFTPVRVGTLLDKFLEALVFQELRYEEQEAEGKVTTWRPSLHLQGIYKELLEYYVELQVACSQGKISLFWKCEALEYSAEFRLIFMTYESNYRKIESYLYVLYLIL